MKTFDNAVFFMQLTMLLIEVVKDWKQNNNIEDSASKSLMNGALQLEYQYSVIFPVELNEVMNDLVVLSKSHYLIT